MAEQVFVSTFLATSNKATFQSLMKSQKKINCAQRQPTKSFGLGVQAFFNRIFSVLFLYVLCVYLCKYTMYV